MEGEDHPVLLPGAICFPSKTPKGMPVFTILKYDRFSAKVRPVWSVRKTIAARPCNSESDLMKPVLSCGAVWFPIESYGGVQLYTVLQYNLKPLLNFRWSTWNKFGSSISVQPDYVWNGEGHVILLSAK